MIDHFKSYTALVKPGIIQGNAITAAAGFFLASKGAPDWPLFFFMLLGLSLVIASACTFNNIIDQKADQVMARTRSRPLATGAIGVQSASFAGMIFGLCGAWILAVSTHLFALIAALAGFCFYVGVYSVYKYRSPHATLLGSIAGSAPPLVGYCAASGCFDLGAVLLFALLFFWQMPHSYAIGLMRLDDYANASIPILPCVAGLRATKWHMLAYSVCFTLIAVSLPLFGYVGYAYLICAVAIGLMWLALCIKGLKTDEYRIWARKMFSFSLLAIVVLSLMLSLDSIL